MSQPADDVVKQAGRGALAIAAAKATFLVSGLGLTLIMPRIILDAAGDQDPAQFGRYRVSAQTMSILAQAVLLSILQVVSKFGAEQRAAGVLVGYGLAARPTRLCDRRRCAAVDAVDRCELERSGAGAALARRLPDPCLLRPVRPSARDRERGPCVQRSGAP